MLLFVAMTAIVIPLVLLAVLRIPAKYGMTISALLVALLAATVWKMESLAIAASSLQGMHRAVTVLWILLGAIFLMNTLKDTGFMERIKLGFYTISSDMRVQSVLIGVFFVSLLEGLAGFGSPVAIAAPLMVSLGFRPMAAVVLSLVGDTIAVTFGAVGTPMLVGLSNVPTYNDAGFLAAIAQQATRIDFLLAFLMPTIMVITLIFGFGENRKSKNIRAITEVLPWALVTGFTYACLATVLSYVIPPEFIGILAGGVTLVIATIMAHRNILIDKDINWRTHHHAPKVNESVRSISLVRAWLPYGFVILLLGVTRLLPDVKAWLGVVGLDWSNILGYGMITSVWPILLSPGTIFIIAAIGALLMSLKHLTGVYKPIGQTLRMISISALALIPTLMMVQIFINSGINESGLLAMPAYIARSFAEFFGENWLFAAPLLGSLGAFIAGSSTVSTLTMAPIQFDIAIQLGTSTSLVLAQQLSGAAAGNMIAVHNIVAATTVVGLYHQEGHVIRRILPVVVVYLVLSIIGALAVSTLL